MEQMMSLDGVQQLLNSPQLDQMASSPGVQGMMNSLLPAAASQVQGNRQARQPGINPAALFQQILPMFSQVRLVSAEQKETQAVSFV